MNKGILTIFISNSDLAFTFRNEVQVICNLTLSDDDLFRIIHEQFHLGEENVHKLLVILEHGIILDYILEDELNNLMLQTG